MYKQFYYKELQLIRETKKPLVGICLGYELIAKAFGARLKRQKAKTIGVKEISIAPEYFGLEHASNYRVYEAHRWVVAEPGVLEVIGFSAAGPEIIKHPVRKIVGFQFHPEVIDPQNDGLLLLNCTVSIFGST